MPLLLILLVLPAWAILLLPSIGLQALIAGWIVVLSLFLLLLYRSDKHRAIKSQSRIPERVLHRLAYFGGWPGALLGQQLFRHKIAKPSFRRLTWLGISIHQLLAFAWISREFWNH